MNLIEYINQSIDRLAKCIFNGVKVSIKRTLLVKGQFKKTREKEC
jgi:hypothetical protein